MPHNIDDLTSVFRAWDQLGKNELSSEELRSLCPANISFDVFWSEGLRDGLLVQGASGNVGMGVPAINLLDASDARISPAQAQEIIQDVISFVSQWNTLATAHQWPTIALAALWGSCARSDAIDHGDVDVAIVWRAPQKQPLALNPTPNLAKALACAAALPAHPSRWDVEDTVEQWISSIKHVSLSGVDQWAEMSTFPQFSTKLLARDPFWVSDQNMGDGVKKYEQDVVLSHLNCFQDGVAPRAVIK